MRQTPWALAAPLVRATLEGSATLTPSAPPGEEGGRRQAGPAEPMDTGV
jgi:hypothetical protein